MAKKAYPLRINEQVLAAMQRWADDELRSLNAQIEFVLRQALVDSGRVKLVRKVVTELEPENLDSAADEASKQQATKQSDSNRDNPTDADPDSTER